MSERHRQTDRKIDSKIDSRIERKIDTKIDSRIERQKNGKTDRQTEKITGQREAKLTGNFIWVVCVFIFQPNRKKVLQYNDHFLFF